MKDLHHPHLEGKVIKDTLCHVATIAAMFVGLWFVGECYDTYTAATARFDAMQQVQYSKHAGERYGE